MHRYKTLILAGLLAAAPVALIIKMKKLYEQEEEMRFRSMQQRHEEWLRRQELNREVPEEESEAEEL